MSAGRAVVASRTGPVEEVIEHGKTGLLVDFFDVEGLARQVVSVLKDPPGHRILGLRARELVVERYDLRAKCLPELIALMLGD
jgi:glycosyltransferase involved in cell wall biosynthesis